MVNPYLILGLGTSAQQLLQKFKPDFSERGGDLGFRIETLDFLPGQLDGCDFDRRALKSLVDSAEKVLLVVFAGGKGESAIAMFTSEYAISKKTPVDVLQSKPFNWEGGRRLTVANTLAENLSAIGAKVVAVDADSLETTEFDSASEAIAALNAGMSKEVNRWALKIDSSSKPSIRVGSVTEGHSISGRGF